MASEGKLEQVSISPLLKRLAYHTNADIPVSADEIASAFALIFDDQLSVIQSAALLTLLHSTGKDREPDVIAKCSLRMRDAANKIEPEPLKQIVKSRGKREGLYKGGLVSLVVVRPPIVLTYLQVRHCRDGW
jgi:anthranilate phosphoribosyltransferase